MTILLTGVTGTVGAFLSRRLSEEDLSVQAMTRSAETSRFPKNFQVVKGDFSELMSLRSAMEGVSTLFLLNAVRPDEFHQAITAANAANEAGVKSVVYLSVMNAEKFVNVSHFAAKVATERAIRSLGFSGTILRTNYFMQNDLNALPFWLSIVCTLWQLVLTASRWWMSEILQTLRRSNLLDSSAESDWDLLSVIIWLVLM